MSEHRYWSTKFQRWIYPGEQELPLSDAQILACNGTEDEPLICAADEDLIAFGRAVLAAAYKDREPDDGYDAAAHARSYPGY